MATTSDPPIPAPELSPARTDARTVLHRYLVAAAIWYAVYLVAPPALAGPWYVIGGIGTATMVALRVRQLSEPVRGVARLMLFAGVSAVLGAVVRGIESLSTGVDYPFPSVADAFILTSYGLLIAAVSLMVRRRVPHITIDPVLDALVGGIAIGVLQWTLVVLPYVEPASPTPATLVLNLAYSSGSLLLVTIAVFALVAGGQRSPANRILAAALLTITAVDLSTTLVIAGVVPEELRTLLAHWRSCWGPPVCCTRRSCCTRADPRTRPSCAS